MLSTERFRENVVPIRVYKHFYCPLLLSLTLSTLKNDKELANANLIAIEGYWSECGYNRIIKPLKLARNMFTHRYSSSVRLICTIVVHIDTMQ